MIGHLIEHMIGRMIATSSTLKMPDRMIMLAAAVVLPIKRGDEHRNKRGECE